LALLRGSYAAWFLLAFLSPTMVEKVIEGRAPVELNLRMLMTTRVALIPGEKVEQAEMLRLKGEVLLLKRYAGAAEKVERCYRNFTICRRRVSATDPENCPPHVLFGNSPPGMESVF
jgi:hypothetical protein